MASGRRYRRQKEVLTEMVREYNVNNTNVEHLDVERRAEARRWSCTTCELWVFGKDEPRKRILDVVTRNSSFRGLSIIAKMPEAIPNGRPIEVVIAGPDKTRTNFAGTVAFCRGVGGEYCEIGVRVQAVGPHWILTGDVESSKARYPWFAEALQAAKWHSSLVAGRSLTDLSIRNGRSSAI